MNTGGFSVDFSKFDIDFKRITETTIPDAAKKGIFNAVNELKHDSDREPPKTPKDEGNLKGSWTSGVTIDSASNVEVLAGFNIEYAVYVHEMFYGIGAEYITPATWSEPGSGPKFLESKIYRHWKKYLEIINRTIISAGK